MATVQTLSPSGDRTCLLKSSNTDAILDGNVKKEFVKSVNEHPGFTSAPEVDGLEERNKLLQQHQGRNSGRKRRKRRNSCSENSGSVNNQNPKRRRGGGGYHKRHSSTSAFILPNKFLLGGNIADPLNLNSMMDENINRALNAVTPSSSPLPPRNSIIDIVTPQDVTDPLGLNSGSFISPSSGKQQKNRAKRSRRRRSHVLRQQDSQNTEDLAILERDEDEQGILYLSKSKEQSPTKRTHKNNAPNKKKKQSPPAMLSVTTNHAQTIIRDPIVSPAIPQDIRRSKSAHGTKQRRRKHGGKPGTNETGIQTDSSDILDENLRCRSEKLSQRKFLSPVKRRRTFSENLISTAHWEEKCETGDYIEKKFFAEHPTVHVKTETEKDLDKLLLKPIGGSLQHSDADAPDQSPAQNYMNQEKKSPQKTSALTVQQLHNEKTDIGVLTNPTKPKEDSKPDIVRKNGNITKSKRPYNARFQYGNYSQYYGYRNNEKFKDVRMECLKKEWFKEKDVLDVGCNSGHLTLLIARDYEPRKIVGIDIDENLVRAARNNVRHYASDPKPGKSTPKFPASMAISLGPLASPPVETGKDDTTASFPNNVNFFQGNYVPKKDEFLRFQEPEYDVILCLSVSKWIHLNWGDEGLIRLFHRAFKQLRAGGMFILEPQPWSSYSSKRKMCEQLNENYQKIKIRPDSFTNILIKEIGFEKVEHLSVQNRNNSKGFQRPIQVYHKPE